MRFLNWMSSPPGRAVRALVGLALVVLGLSVVHGATGAAMAVLGLLPLTTALLDVCPIRPVVELCKRRRPAQPEPPPGVTPGEHSSLRRGTLAPGATKPVAGGHR